MPTNDPIKTLRDLETALEDLHYAEERLTETRRAVAAAKQALTRQIGQVPGLAELLCDQEPIETNHHLVFIDEEGGVTVEDRRSTRAMWEIRQAIKEQQPGEVATA
ncbi:MAG: hypothetical protein ACOC0M_00640 [Halomonas sp.]